MGTWTMGDLVDMEFLVHEDALSAPDGQEALRRRDREIYQEYQAGKNQSPDRRGLFRFWLEKRRKERFQGRASFGEEIGSYIFLAAFLLFLTGLLLAAGAVASFFHGAEASAPRPEPINVLAFGLVCIAFPFAVSLYGIWVALGQRAFPRLPKAPALFRGTLFTLFQFLLNKAARRVAGGMGAERRLDAHALAGALKQRAVSRKGAISAQFFLVVQCLGIAFTLALPAFSRVDYEFHSRVFGWQSTDRQVTAAGVYGAVKTIALPWSWLQPEGTGFPTEAQVAQTRFVRFQDPSAFPPDAAPVWANFLFMAGLVYGLLPRLFLAWLSNRHAKAALHDEDFEELRFDALWERMTLSPGAFGRPAESITNVSFSELLTSGSAFTGIETAACKIVLPPEAHARLEAIQNWLKTNKGWEAIGSMEFSPGLEEKERLIAALATPGDGTPATRILIVQESFMPPVQQFLDFLRKLRGAIGEKGVVLVGLLGKPDGAPLARPPAKIEVEVWKKKVASLGDPRMDVIAFLTPE
ncbi:MAG TPA: DUF2868 domain-containing protein [Chthoniobacteraceae bacterium]|nr:DUF2868 domain-containing protein [Chthoniobacteraceae bacterium]